MTSHGTSGCCLCQWRCFVRILEQCSFATFILFLKALFTSYCRPWKLRRHWPPRKSSCWHLGKRFPWAQLVRGRSEVKAGANLWKLGQLSAAALQSAGEKSHVARPYLRVEFPNDPIVYSINSDSIVTRVQHTVRNPPHQTDDFSRISIPTLPFAQGVPPQAHPAYLGRVSERCSKILNAVNDSQ